MLFSSFLKKVVYTEIVVVFLLAMLELDFSICVVEANTTMWTVDDDGTANFQTIQEAVDAADDGDSIYVHSGTYHERLTINKPLALTGENRENTIIDGDRIRNVVEITADDVIIKGFTIQNSNRSSPYAAIRLSGRRCNVTGNHMTRSKIAVFVISHDIIIEENRVTHNGQGIALYSCSYVTVKANNMSANTVGISLALSSYNTVTDNRAENSSFGGHGITLSSNSFNNTIQNNNLIGNYHGMWLSSSYENLIINNIIANNQLLGVELATSSNNTFFHNDVINNPTPVRVDTNSPSHSICMWDNGYDSGGNYWHEYANVDEKSGSNQDEPGSDEIWDNAYRIDKNNTDRYPSVRPYRDISHIVVDDEKLIARAGDDRTVEVGSTVQFDAGDSTGRIAVYRWDFGDGTNGTGIRCTHTYLDPGTYRTTLTITDPEGHESTDQLTVKVVAEDPSPIADIPHPWISALAGFIVIVMMAAVFWKRRVSKKAGRTRAHKVKVHRNATFLKL